MATATAFETTVHVAEYHAKRALVAGKQKDDARRARHEAIMRRLIDGSDYPDLGYEELGTRLGRSKAAVLKIEMPVLALA